MRSFKEIITILKAQEKVKKSKKVFDKDIAYLLKIDPSRFATLKKRDSTPFVELLEFCREHSLCSNELFFD